MCLLSNYEKQHLGPMNKILPHTTFIKENVKNVWNKQVKINLKETFFVLKEFLWKSHLFRENKGLCCVHESFVHKTYHPCTVTN